MRFKRWISFSNRNRRGEKQTESFHSLYEVSKSADVVKTYSGESESADSTLLIK